MQHRRGVGSSSRWGARLQQVAAAELPQLLRAAGGGLEGGETPKTRVRASGLSQDTCQVGLRLGYPAAVCSESSRAQRSGAAARAHHIVEQHGGLVPRPADDLLSHDVHSHLHPSFQPCAPLEVLQAAGCVQVVATHQERV